MEQNYKKRAGEDPEFSVRYGRFYLVGREWYFSVRETQDQGPFSSRDNAEQGLKIFLADIDKIKSKIKILS